MIEKKVIFQEKGHKALNPQNKIDSHNFPFTLNSGIGCHFGCQYCFIQGFPFNVHAVFGEEVKVKLWMAEKLEKELHKYQDLPQYLKRVQVNVSTEGYLPVAMIRTRKQYGRDVMKEVLEVFKKHWDEGNCWMVHLLTKSHMIRKHLDIIQNMRDQIQLELTITTLDEERKKLLEGLAPSVRKRLDIIREFSEAGIFVRVMCMPLIGTREEGAALREVCLGHGAMAFKHKGVNYWDENALLGGEAIKIRGREDEVYEDLLIKSSESVIENGHPRTMIVPMPVIIKVRKNKRWNSYKVEDFEDTVMTMENSGYSDLNDIDWGYIL